ncbi:MAG: zinc-ribbon domain-containing protein [Rikenellaceae bacterium]|nr:zinc-ribbon domain-containing protein [Rikenellaceae bacterium]
MANQIYCKHCGKLIDADSSFCMHCGGAINSKSKTTPQANKQDFSFIRQLDILGGKLLIDIINILKWCGRTIINFGKFIKRHWKRILIFILGIVGAILLICLGCAVVEGYRAMFIMSAIILIILTLYFSCSKSIKLILPSSILLLCSYSALTYYYQVYIYGANTTFFDTVKREFYWITPNYTIPDHATSIGFRVFDGCDGLTSITIPNSVTSIEDRAFYDCTSLTSVYCKATTPPTGGYNMFSYYNYGYNKIIPIGCKIYVPRNSVKAYKSAKGWKEYANYIVGYDF